MYKAKTVSVPLGRQYKLWYAQSPQTNEEMQFMYQVHNASGVGSLIYAMVCSRPDLAYVVVSFVGLWKIQWQH